MTAFPKEILIALLLFGISTLFASPLPLKECATRQLVGKASKEFIISEDDCKVLAEFFWSNDKAKNEHHSRTTSSGKSETIKISVDGLSVEVTFVDQSNGKVFAQISAPGSQDDQFIQEVKEFLEKFWVMVLQRTEELIFEIDSTVTTTTTTKKTTTKEPTNVGENSVASSSFSTTSTGQKTASGDHPDKDGNGSTSAKPTFLVLFISVGIFLYSSM